MVCDCYTDLDNIVPNVYTAQSEIIKKLSPFDKTDIEEFVEIAKDCSSIDKDSVKEYLEKLNSDKTEIEPLKFYTSTLYHNIVHMSNKIVKGYKALLEESQKNEQKKNNKPRKRTFTLCNGANANIKTDDGSFSLTVF